ncbi:hypothetical protein GCM10011409_22120 [Lentibacillus populi]|uniref:Uncharacterized protein n=1 Tax=Lentibacillus populi TaxID=1827502 RepID=A0A9W5TY08_9BACI|nr:hypothetical protein [Lentibacillus populi]GGB44118.1 hypothetical protein GCM10011409_22120 [Lentibacillus populi]
MNKILKKYVLTFMSAMLFSSGLLMVVPKAHASETNASDHITQRSQIAYQQALYADQVSNEGQVGIQGVKSKAVVKVGQLLRAGGDKVIDAARTFNIIDASTAKTFKNNSKKIGNWLKNFENAGKDAATMVRNQLPGFLRDNTKMGKGTAENISIAVSWAIRMADILFL